MAVADATAAAEPLEEPPGDVVRSVRVARDAVGGVFTAAPMANCTMFVRPRGMPPGRLQQADGGGVIGRSIGSQEAGGAACRLAQDVDVVLHGDGDAGQGAGRIGRGRGLEGGLAVKGDIGVGGPVRLNGVRRQVDQFGGGKFLAAPGRSRPLGPGCLECLTWKERDKNG